MQNIQAVVNRLLNPGNIVAAELDGEAAGNSVVSGFDSDDHAFAGDLQLSAVARVWQNYLQGEAVAEFSLEVGVKESSQGVQVAQSRNLELVRLVDSGHHS